VAGRELRGARASERLCLSATHSVLNRLMPSGQATMLQKTMRSAGTPASLRTWRGTVYCEGCGGSGRISSDCSAGSP